MSQKQVEKCSVMVIACASLLSCAVPVGAADDPWEKPLPPLFVQSWGDNVSVILGWEPSPSEDVIEYRVYQLLVTEDGPAIAQRVGEASGLNFTDEDPEQYEAVNVAGWYAYVVTAWDGSQESVPSNPTIANPRYPHCALYVHQIPPSFVPPIECLFPPPFP